MISYVQQKYGKYNVAHILAFGTFQSRSAIREIGKVMGIKDYRINEINAYINSQLSIKENIEKNSELQKLLLNIKILINYFHLRKIESILKYNDTCSGNYL